ncbi:MAG TPA: glycogen-binding domain-containing protein [Gemmatimonadales bacterium]
MMPRRRVPLLVILGTVCVAAPGAGQVRGSLDVGAGTYRPDRAIPGGVASIAPTLYLDGESFRLGLAGIYSDAPAGRWNFQGTGLAQIRSPQLGPLQLEATGRFDFTRHFAAHGVTVASGELRGYLRPSRGSTLWAGHLRGNASALAGRRPLRRNLIGASTRVGGLEIGLSLASSTFDLIGGVPRGSTGLNDTTLAGVPTLPEGAESPATRRMSLTDAVLSTRWRVADVDLDLALGRRFGHNTPELTIWGVSGSRALTDNLALVAGAGRAGSDPVTAVPGARYVVMGLRLRLGPPATAIHSAPAPQPEQAPFRVGPPLPAGREIAVRAPGAGGVELAADFTDWRPVALEPSADGSWRVVLPIPPGLHRLAVRIDGGPWRAPAGSRAVASEFGGEVAEIVID